MPTTSITQKEQPLHAHAKKLIRFAEIYAKGIYSIAEAARQAGYKQSVANGKAYRWVGKSREESEYPVLWDYYEKLRKENLREFEITHETLAAELRLIAFSDVTRFIDLPRKEYQLKQILAVETEFAINAVNNYPDELRDYEQELSAYNRAVEKQDAQVSGKKKKLTQPQAPTPPTPRQYELANNYLAMTDEERLELMIWKNYRAGSIRLKNAEEIPAALYPAIAELSETRDGVKLKLHDKISALDKLAKWKRMYEEEADKGSGVNAIKEINITVNGSRSTLQLNQDGVSQPEPPEEKAA